MGKNREERLRLADSQASARATINDRRADALSSERAMALTEGLLGSDAQLTGAYGDPRLAKYTERYAVDPEATSLLLERGKDLRRKTGGIGRSPDDFTRVADQANALLDQAEAAARAGDYATADQLYEQAQGVIPKFGSSAWQLRGTRSTEQATAEGLAFSPTGQLVGEEVRRARDLQARGEGYDRFYDALTEDSFEALRNNRTLADRQLAISERGARARMGDIAASRGAARTPYIQEALEGRLSESYATERANLDLQFATETAKVAGEAHRFLEGYTDQLAKSSAELARWFVTGAPGFREEHQVRLDRLASMAIDLQDRIATRTQQFLDSRQDGMGEGARMGIQAGTAIASIIAGAFTAGAGGALVAGAGSAALAASTAAGQMTSAPSNPYDRALNASGGLSMQAPY